MELIDNTFKVNVYFSKKRKHFKKFKKNISEFDGLCVKYKNNIYVGVFNNKNSTLSHELFHCIVFLNEIIGSNINIETQEYNAYYIEKLFTIIEKML